MVVVVGVVEERNLAPRPPFFTTSSLTNDNQFRTCFQIIRSRHWQLRVGHAVKFSDGDGQIKNKDDEDSGTATRVESEATGVRVDGRESESVTDCGSSVIIRCTRVGLRLNG